MSKRCASQMNAPAAPKTTFDVFVGGIPVFCNKAKLLELGREFDAVSARMLQNNKGNHKNGFVTFTCVNSAKHFIYKNNNKDPFDAKIKLIARFADGKAGERKKLHIGKLKKWTTEADLEAIGRPFGEVIMVKLVPKQGCGFITFVAQHQAEACIAGSVGRPYTVKFAKNGAKNHKQNAPLAKRQKMQETAPWNANKEEIVRPSPSTLSSSPNEFSPERHYSPIGLYNKQVSPAMSQAMTTCSTGRLHIAM